MDTAQQKFLLSPLDHLSSRLYFPKLLYFSIPEDGSANIIGIFQDGLAKTLQVLPIYAGSLGLDQDARKQGTLAVVAPYSKADQILRTADLRDKYDLGAFEAKEFAPDGIDLDLVWPQPPDNPVPVLMAQVSLIRGGAILYMGIHHCTMDEVGMVNLLRVWSTYCRNEDGAALIKPTWFDRGPLEYGFGTGKPEDHPYKPINLEGEGGLIDRVAFFHPSPTVQCVVLFFNDESLGKLKSMVLKAVQEHAANGPEWVSTNDALCAFLWSSISAARLSVDPKPPKDFTSTFRMTMDLRSKLFPPMPEDYCGNCFMTVGPKAEIASIASSQADPTAQLATAALAIRSAYTAVTDTTVRDLIQMVNNLPDLTFVKPVHKKGYESHHASLQTTSWARQPYYTMDWGAALGHHIRRFRGRNLQTDGLTAIFPHIPSSRLEEGGLEVLIGLERSHLLWLKHDAPFNRFVQWRCVTGKPLVEDVAEEEGRGVGVLGEEDGLA